ncbi:MAG TPA: TetR/AcrR family transcriptional regulator [Gemmatimonadaceae bacterium]|nr:TetR/AcrR family transcriptional regulator [Gemmatimonadaceae bacterium]
MAAKTGAHRRVKRWERRPDERADALLDAALRVVAERGYKRTRLEQIAEAAGVSVGTVYYYFDNKEDLLVQAVRSRFRAVFAETEAVVAGMKEPAAVKLRYVLRTGWRYWVTPEFGQIFRVMIGEIGPAFPDLLQAWATAGPLHGWALVARLIGEGVASGEFRPDADAAVMARAVTSALMLQALLHVHLNFQAFAPMDVDRIFDSTVEGFFTSLRITGHPSGRGAQ